jgi:hypothetical protein
LVPTHQVEESGAFLRGMTPSDISNGENYSQNDLDNPEKMGLLKRKTIDTNKQSTNKYMSTPNVGTP